METAFNLHVEHIQETDVNMLLELYMMQGVYDKPLEVLNKCSGVTLFSAGDTVLTKLPEEGIDSVLKLVTVPDDLAIDLRIRLVVCLIHLNCKECAKVCTQV